MKKYVKSYNYLRNGKRVFVTGHQRIINKRKRIPSNMEIKRRAVYVIKLKGNKAHPNRKAYDGIVTDYKNHLGEMFGGGGEIQATIYNTSVEEVRNSLKKRGIIPKSITSHKDWQF